jgi:hypothetical protein
VDADPSTSAAMVPELRANASAIVRTLDGELDASQELWRLARLTHICYQLGPSANSLYARLAGLQQQSVHVAQSSANAMSSLAGAPPEDAGAQQDWLLWWEKFRVPVERRDGK